MTIELNPITSGYSTGLINDNFQAIEDYVNDKLLQRDGVEAGEINQMEVDLDMNSHFVYNLPEPLLEHQAARLKDVQDAIAGGSANLITFTPYGLITSENVQGAIQELVDELGNVEVTTSTGTQGVEEALDLRAIYKETKSGLDSINPLDLSDEQVAIVQGTPFRWDSGAGEWFAQGPINVKMYGAVGDGVTDDGAVIKTAIENLREGESLFFPPGHYFTTYQDPSVLANWCAVPASGVKIWAHPGTVILENILILIAGSFGSSMDIGATGFTTGDNQVSTASAHGLEVGDTIQLLSQRNAYTTDGGEYQLGSTNPTNNNTPTARFSEIHTVRSVDSTTQVTIDGLVMYPDYEDNTTSLSFPMAGVTSAQIRKINPLNGVVLEGLEFVNIGNSSFDELFISAALYPVIRDCRFVAGGDSGKHLRSENTLGLKIEDCSSSRSPVGSSGSGWNSFVIGAGCQDTVITGVHFNGESQAIDFSPNLDPTSVVFESVNSDYLTVQLMTVKESVFQDCGDATTSHPGTFLFSFIGNTVNGGSTGVRARSRSNTITGNKILTSRTGVALSAFYENTLISSNNIEQQVSSVWSGSFVGVAISPMSSEVMNDNNIRRCVIDSNNIYAFSGTRAAIQMRHVGNGVPPSGSFTEFTDSVKTALSNYTIKGNTFNGCGVEINRYINGVAVMDNEFYDGSGLAAFISSPNDSVRHSFGLNKFGGGQPTNQITTGQESELTYGYSTGHKVGQNLYALGISNSLVNTSLFATEA